MLKDTRAQLLANRQKVALKEESIETLRDQVFYIRIPVVDS